MTDVLLFHTADGGNVEVVGGRFTLDDTPATAAYLSLFGGNESDAGTQATAKKQWWGNLTEPDQTRHYRSETQHVLRGLPAIPANLVRVRDAVGRDLAWMTEALGAEVSAAVTMPGRNRLALDITITIDGEAYPLRLDVLWGTDR